MNYTNNSFNSYGYNSSIPNIFDNNTMTGGSGYNTISFGDVSENNIGHIKTIQSFTLLNKNWDSYNAEKPSFEAILKAISFSLWLSQRSVEIFFTAPIADGDILVELKNENANIEFVFSKNNSDKVLAWCDGDLMQEAPLNETTQNSYLKWLICPDGNCPDFK